MTRGTAVSEERNSAAILVAGDSSKELVDLKYLLVNYFSNVSYVATDDEGVEQFVERSPVLLVLACSRIDLSEEFYLRLFRSRKEVRLHLHQTLLLCTSRESRKAFQLCRTGIFDEYVIDRPLYDPQRVVLSLEQALGRLYLQRQISSLQDKLRRSNHGATPFDLAIYQKVKGLDPSYQQLRQLMVDTPPAPQIQTGVEQLGGMLTDICNEFTEHVEGVEQQSREILVMIVDDDPFYRGQLTMVIEQAGYQVIQAEDGEVALSRLHATRPDVILMDYKMPKLDGLSTLRRIRQDEEINKIPVIMLTSYSQGGLVKRALQLGVAGYIIKPGEPEALLAKIEAVTLSQESEEQEEPGEGEG